MNYYDPKDKTLLKEGTVIAVRAVYFNKCYIRYRRLKMNGHLKQMIKVFVAQIEHTVIVTKDGPVLTTKNRLKSVSV
ncbi:methionine aminopeptidase [Staphylococcus gallinarum]|uniref:Methionine aminopeptidase n=1 Tax=Staphylococcus gallinarum TaxID=1293 RepID=A0A380FIK4_STAGA|nr:methionine aminopeptidase [Staphylococcus gallinarum]